MGLIRKIKIAIDDLIRLPIIYMPGILGKKLRYWYYKKKFKRCGKNVIIDEGVLIQGAEWISVGDNVWIDRYSILMAGKPNLEGSIVKINENKNFKGEMGELFIGSGIHIGSFNILQAHGGLYIGNNITTSAGVKIYSLSNYPYDEENLQNITFANYMVKESERVSYIVSPIVIEDGVWIALDCLILGGTIGNNSFISSQSIVYKDIPENSYASGRPAEKIKERFKL